MPENTGGWMEIFKGGKQRAANGREYDGDAIIDQAVANFNAAEHKPPLVIGHPKDNAPAWGWVKELKTEVAGGVKRLFAMPDQVQPEFKEMVNRGLFRNRSASFYSNGALRHVGFLGAMPPAVKGLEAYSFAEDAEPLTFEFSDWNDRTIARTFRRLKNWMIEKFGKDDADKVLDEWDLESMQEEAVRPEPINAEPAFSEPVGAAKENDMPNFTEADVNAAAAAAREDERKKVLAEFAEQQKADRNKERKAAIADFCEKGVSSGAIAPAWIDGGLKEFMESLPAEDAVNFGEASGEKSPYAWFVEFIQGLPRLVEFKEIAGKGSSVGPGAISRAQYDAMDGATRAKHVADGGTITD